MFHLPDINLTFVECVTFFRIWQKRDVHTRGLRIDGPLPEERERSGLEVMGHLSDSTGCAPRILDANERSKSRANGRTVVKHTRTYILRSSVSVCTCECVYVQSSGLN